MTSVTRNQAFAGSGKIVICLNTAWNLVNFRAGLVRSLVANGFEVVAVAPSDQYAPQVEKLGCRYVALPMDNKGTHPAKDMLLLWRFFGLLRRERPHLFIAYTVKPNIYGSFVARALGIPFINNITGLGSAFAKNNVVTRAVRILYRLAIARSCRVFFHNEDDRKTFLAAGLVRSPQSERIPGSGIDLERFSAMPPPPLEGRAFRFLLVARMLWNKGVGEFVAAARLVKRRFPEVEFHLLGFLDVKNPDAITREQMQAWVDEDVVKYVGETDDVRPHIAAADCIVLPSYYGEGAPRSLLEAAAMGRPIVTTITAGCRDVVQNGVNGFLCQPGDAADLADKLEMMIGLPPQARDEMGRRGRERMEREFDERIVIRRYLEVIGEIVNHIAPV